MVRKIDNLLKDLYAPVALLCVCSLTYVYSGISVHDSPEGVKVKLWSTVVLHFSYGLPEPV